MKLPKLIIIITIVTMLQIQVMAESEETLWPGIYFSSLSEFQDYLNKGHQDNSFDEIGAYYATLNSIDVPKQFVSQTDLITGIAAEFYNYYEVQYQLEDTHFRLVSCYNLKYGERKYNEAKSDYDSNDSETMPQKHMVGEATVYSYYELHQTTYVWKQDEQYYCLIVDKEPNEEYLKYCDVVSMPLNIQQSKDFSQAETTSNNPATGR